MSRADPFSLPEWQALARESKLSMQLIGSGVTALGNANYADKKGEYYVAFFGLSIGIERLSKLILLADFAIENGGAFPDQKFFKHFGHNLKDLLIAVEAVAAKYSLKLEFTKPADQISVAVVDCLDSFADASRGRYSNFGTIGDPNIGAQFEPLSQWWASVAEPILQKHFYGTAADNQVRARAQLAEAMMGPFSLVRHTAEDGTPLSDVESASYRTGLTPYVQKFGRYYALLTVRWLSEVFSELSNYGCYKRNVDALFGHHEHFRSYQVDDTFLKTRKRWPLV